MARRDAIAGDTHLRCPQCSYDLHGIPERRCPECGFGFDCAALRNLAELAEINREGVARRVVVARLVAIAAAYPEAAVAMRLYGPAGLITGATVAVMSFVGLVWVTEVYHGPRAVPALMLAAAAWMLLVVTFFVSPGGLLVATAVTGFARAQRLAYWPRLYLLANSPHADDRRYLDRLSAWATGLLAAATVCVALGWMG